MIIPIKCFSCGAVLADKYEYYIRETNKLKKQNTRDEIVYLTKDNAEKSPEGIVLDLLKLNKLCCRRHMLTHVDI
jgi:DNA-directed RNA polymerase subunit N